MSGTDMTKIQKSILDGKSEKHFQSAKKKNKELKYHISLLLGYPFFHMLTL